MSGYAHMASSPTEEEDAAYLDTWNRLYFEGPVSKWSLPEEMEETTFVKIVDKCQGTFDMFDFPLEFDF